MEKLIDSDDFAKRLNGALAEFANMIKMPIEDRLRLLVIVAKAFQDQPEVDAVTVVRCKDCHWGTVNNECHREITCFASKCLMDFDDFCSNGYKRKDGVQDAEGGKTV